MNLLLPTYLSEFETCLKGALPTLCRDKHLLEATKYCLLSGGKRFRPLIILAIGSHLSSVENVLPSALSVEYFHTSSLIVDDLPSMDNDDYRRGKLSLHKMFGERDALLVSYGLISAAFREIERNARVVPWGTSVLPEALEIASRCSGFDGATTGQYWDITLLSPTLKEIEAVIYHKTITLFELSFCLGWLFGGGNPSSLGAVKTLAFNFGMAFQIKDDLLDLEHDLECSSTINIAAHLGRCASVKKMEEHLACFFSELSSLGLDCDVLKNLAEGLK